jgi:hexulose-6-phosphate isomerase
MTLNRRDFIHTAATASALAGLGSIARGSQSQAEDDGKFPLKGKLYKTLKIGMVRDGKTLTEKFKLAKEAGFAAIELNAPTVDVKAGKLEVEETMNLAVSAAEASKEAEFPIDGTVNSSHWQIRHTDKDEEIRKLALESLKLAIKATHRMGGHTCLLVVGHGKDGTEEEVWARAIENIKQAIPLASRLGVHIAIENVWNSFLYDHAKGDEWNSEQTADKFVKFVDELNSPWVGMQFDIGNHWKYGSMGDWIRQLGHRIIKLDVKGFNRAANRAAPKKDNGWRNIGHGDIDFRDVRKALTEINFMGWCAAEVGGGDLKRLKDISANMDRVFGLS